MNDAARGRGSTGRADIMRKIQAMRFAVAMLIVLALCAWPAWTMWRLRPYIARPQDRAVDTYAQWQSFETHFKPVRQAFAPGTVLAYQRSERITRDDRRIHDVHFACIPLIVAEPWYVQEMANPSDLILADLADDDELEAMAAREGWQVVKRFAPGLAVVRKQVFSRTGVPPVVSSQTKEPIQIHPFGLMTGETPVPLKNVPLKNKSLTVPEQPS